MCTWMYVTGLKSCTVRNITERVSLRTCSELVDGDGLLRVHEGADPEAPDGPGVDLQVRKKGRQAPWSLSRSLPELQIVDPAERLTRNVLHTDFHK